MTKAIVKAKKYGTPYARKILLQQGDIKEIAAATGYSYHTVCYQLSGTRKLQPTVKAMADKLADRTQAHIDAIDKI